MLTFIDLFSGIGGFRLGMEHAGHKCMGHCEIDKHANISYNAIHQPKEDEWFATDIRAVEPGEIPDFDCLCAGFPCQDNSILTPVRLGIEGDRSGLFYEICRITRVKKPKYLFLENVEGLLSVGGAMHFTNVLTSLEELGYIPEWQVCNSRRLLPHNRPRVFIIGHRGDAFKGAIFPIYEIIDFASKQEKQGTEAYVACLLTRKGGPSIDETYFCEPGAGPRRPSPRELFKLQGFLPEHADKALAAGVPTGGLRAQAGNSVSVPVIYEIARRLT